VQSFPNVNWILELLNVVTIVFIFTKNFVCLGNKNQLNHGRIGKSVNFGISS